MNCYYITFLPPEIILCICKDKILAWGGGDPKKPKQQQQKSRYRFLVSNRKELSVHLEDMSSVILILTLFILFFCF